MDPTLKGPSSREFYYSSSESLTPFLHENEKFIKVIDPDKNEESDSKVLLLETFDNKSELFFIPLDLFKVYESLQQFIQEHDKDSEIEKGTNHLWVLTLEKLKTNGLLELNLSDSDDIRNKYFQILKFAESYLENKTFRIPSFLLICHCSQHLKISNYISTLTMNLIRVFLADKNPPQIHVVLKKYFNFLETNFPDDGLFQDRNQYKKLIDICISSEQNNTEKLFELCKILSSTFQPEIARVILIYMAQQDGFRTYGIEMINQALKVHPPNSVQAFQILEKLLERNYILLDDAETIFNKILMTFPNPSSVRHVIDRVIKVCLDLLRKKESCEGLTEKSLYVRLFKAAVEINFLDRAEDLLKELDKKEYPKYDLMGLELYLNSKKLSNNLEIMPKGSDLCWEMTSLSLLKNCLRNVPNILREDRFTSEYYELVAQLIIKVFFIKSSDEETYNAGKMPGHRPVDVSVEILLTFIVNLAKMKGITTSMLSPVMKDMDLEWTIFNEDGFIHFDQHITKATTTYLKIVWRRLSNLFDNHFDHKNISGLPTVNLKVFIFFLQDQINKQTPKNFTQQSEIFVLSYFLIELYKALFSEDDSLKELREGFLKHKVFAEKGMRSYQKQMHKVFFGKFSEFITYEECSKKNFCNKLELKNYFFEIKEKAQYSLYSDQALDLELRCDVGNLLISNKLGDILLLEKICLAWDKLKCWKVLASEIEEQTPNFSKLNTIKSLLCEADEFGPWVKQHLKRLLPIKELIFYKSKLTSLPIEILDLPQLEVLSLSYCFLNKIPAEIQGLRQLKKLYLVANSITSLPTEMGALTQLEELNIANNKLHSLPMELKNCVSLKKMDLTDNPLELFPEDLIDFLVQQSVELHGYEIVKEC